MAYPVERCEVVGVLQKLLRAAGHKVVQRQQRAVEVVDAVYLDHVDDLRAALHFGPELNCRLLLWVECFGDVCCGVSCRCVGVIDVCFGVALLWHESAQKIVRDGLLRTALGIL